MGFTSFRNEFLTGKLIKNPVSPPFTSIKDLAFKYLTRGHLEKYSDICQGVLDGNRDVVTEDIQAALEAGSLFPYPNPNNRYVLTRSQLLMKS